MPPNKLEPVGDHVAFERRKIENATAWMPEEKRNAKLRMFDVQNGLVDASSAEKRKATLAKQAVEWERGMKPAETKALAMLRNGLHEDGDETSDRLKHLDESTRYTEVSDATVEAVYKKASRLGMTKGLKSPTVLRRNEAKAKLEKAQAGATKRRSSNPAETRSSQVDKSSTTGAVSPVEKHLANRAQHNGTERTPPVTHQRLVSNDDLATGDEGLALAVDIGYSQRTGSASQFATEGKKKKFRHPAKLTPENEARDKSGQGLGYFKGDPNGTPNQFDTTDTYSVKRPDGMWVNPGKPETAKKAATPDTHIDLKSGSVVGNAMQIFVATFKEERLIASGKRARKYKEDSRGRRSAMVDKNMQLTKSMVGAINRQAQLSAEARKSTGGSQAGGWMRGKRGGEYREVNGNKVYKSKGSQ